MQYQFYIYMNQTRLYTKHIYFAIFDYQGGYLYVDPTNRCELPSVASFLDRPN
jgi:hypothetical protein